MITDFDFRNPSLFGSVIFRPAFNTFELINATQSWSLLFTAGQEDKILGLNPKAGRRFTNLLFAIAASGIVGVLIVQIRLLG
ncbi:MAG: hypothetical protein NW237_00835 [Cyanobacteriota bacterium]|nr:hypothetical protein [Cyanobacteriota bacterium]